MPFIPNAADAFHESQASPDSGHFETLRAGSKATGVVSGCAVTAQGTPDMTVAVASGVIAWAGAKANVTAGNLTLTADGTNPRFYLIVASSAGVKSAVAGTPAPEMAPTESGPVFPAVPANSVVLASVYVPAADTDIDANQIDDMRVFVVPPEPTTNYDLAKALSIPLVKERSQTVTLDAGENQIHGFVMAGGKLFACTLTTPARLVRFNNLEDLTDRTDLTFASDGFHDNASALVHVTETNRLYVTFCHASRTTVSEVHPDTLAVTDVISDTANPFGIANGGSICSDGTHLYITTFTSPSKVLKYRLSDFSLLTTATLTSRDFGHAILYDGVSVFATGKSATDGWVAKLNPADLTFTDAALPAGAPITDDLASAGDYLFVGRESTSSKGLLRISKDTLAYEILWSDLSVIYALYFDGRYLWLAHGTTPGKLSRVDPQSGEAAVHTFATGEDLANEIVSDGERLFVTFYMSPSKVKRLVPPALPVRAPGPAVAVRELDYVADGNTGGSEQTLLSAGVGGILSADGVGFRVTATGKFAANANAKRILLKFGLAAPVVIFDTGSLLFNDANWWLEALCIRTGASAQKWMCKWVCDSSLLATEVTPPVATTQTDTGALNVNMRGVGVADNDVVNEFLLIETVN